MTAPRSNAGHFSDWPTPGSWDRATSDGIVTALSGICNRGRCPLTDLAARYTEECTGCREIHHRPSTNNALTAKSHVANPFVTWSVSRQLSRHWLFDGLLPHPCGRACCFVPDERTDSSVRAPGATLVAKAHLLTGLMLQSLEARLRVP